jgi:hypothetical protein
LSRDLGYRIANLVSHSPIAFSRESFKQLVAHNARIVLGHRNEHVFGVACGIFPRLGRDSTEDHGSKGARLEALSAYVPRLNGLRLFPLPVTHLCICGRSDLLSKP